MVDNPNCHTLESEEQFELGQEFPISAEACTAFQSIKGVTTMKKASLFWKQMELEMARVSI